MAVRKPLTVFTVVASFLLCGGFSIQPGRIIGPDHIDDPSWALLAGNKFSIDEAKGLYKADFNDSVKRLAGHDFRIAGYMMPLDAKLQSNHFIIVRRSPGCPFCPPNAVGEAVEVITKTPTRYTQELTSVEGVLQLEPTSSEGLFFKLSGAKVS